MHRPTVAVSAAVAALFAGAALTACDTDDGRELRDPTADQRAAMPTTTSSSLPGVPLASSTLEPVVTLLPGSEVPGTLAATEPAPFAVTGPWADGEAIPVEHTCDGTDTAPLVSWSAPPAGTVEVAVVVTDRDAENFVHYAAAGFPPESGGLGGAEVPGAVEGTNDFDTTGWRGPCPPEGTTHTYVWTVYALSEPSAFVAGGSGRALWEQLLEASAFASAEFSGTYTRRD